MGVNRADYQIHIGTTADVSGANAGADAVKKLGEAVGKGGEAAEHAGFSHRALHQSIHLLKESVGDALGPVGEIAHFLANPYVLAVAGATLAIKLLVEQHEKAIENTAKLIEASRELAAQFRTAHLQALADTVDKTAEFNRQLAHNRDNIDHVSMALERQLALLTQSTADTQTLAAATEKLYEARVRLSELQGGLTSPEADQAIRLAQEAAERARVERETAEKHQEAAAKRTAADAENAGSGTAAAAAEAARGKRTDIDNLVLVAENAIKDANEALAAGDLKKKADEASAKLSLYGPRYEADLDAKMRDFVSNMHNPEVLSRWQNPANKAADIAYERSVEGGGFDSAKAKADKANAALELQTSIIQSQTKLKQKYENQLKDIDADIAAQQGLVLSRSETGRKLRAEADQIDALADAHKTLAEAELASAHQLNLVTRRTELLKKQQDGTLTPDLAAEFAGMTAANPGNALADIKRQLHQLEQAIRVQNGIATPEQLAQLRGFHENMIGLDENPNRDPNLTYTGGGTDDRIGTDVARSALLSGRQHLQTFRAGYGGGRGTAAQIQELAGMIHDLVAAQTEFHGMIQPNIEAQMNALRADFNNLMTRLGRGGGNNGY